MLSHFTDVKLCQWVKVPLFGESSRGRYEYKTTTPCRFHLRAVGAQPPPSLVVVDKELETVTLVKRALVSDGIHEDKCFGPSDISFQGETLALL
jgi:hypothetical protein